jgi:dihydroorotate dehydrogenase (fumarate)
MPDLSTNYLNFKLKNPFIVSSCGITRYAEGIKKCAEAGASAVVMKSLFEEEIRSASKDLEQTENYHPEVMEYLRSDMELEYHAEKYFNIIREAKQQIDIPLIASLNAATGKWWVRYAKSIEVAGADALELNLYFPGMYEKVISADLEAQYIDTITEVRKTIKLPIAVKLDRYFTSIPAIVRALDKLHIESVVLFNRFMQPDIDIDNFKITSAHFLDDPLGMHYAFRWLSFLYGKGDIKLAGSGGVKNYEHLVKYLLAGASAVESCSVLYEDGLPVIERILKNLNKWMEKNNFSNMKEVIGKVSMESSKNPESFMRAQFIKTVLEGTAD